MSFHVLTVCTGNICRSPAAEFLLREALGPTVTVTSAGTGAVVDHGVEEQMAKLLPMDTSSFRARNLTVQMVRDADLILGMTRFHRAAAVELHPASVRRAFTLREFARIVSVIDDVEGGSPATTLAALTRRAPELRVTTRAEDPLDDDIADPFQLEDAVFEACHIEIGQAVAAIAQAVARATNPEAATPTEAANATEADNTEQPTKPGKYDWWTKEVR
ncbi:MAG: hypothetical protein Q4G46_05830 [Propionibacteriaceae bacterium]|nr:hypothetical protein [Propionibacteriaceae bacterium]